MPIPRNYLKRPLDWVLSSSSSIAVLRVLKDSGHGMSGRATAREAGFNHRGVSRTIARLESLGVVERQGSGKTQLIRLNLENLLVRDALLPLFEQEKRAMGSLRELLRREFEGEALAAALFGSVARGEERPGSDVDLLIVAKGGDKSRLIEKASALGSRLARLYGLRLSPLVKTRAELERRPRRADPLIRRVLDEGVDLLKTRLRDIAA